MGYIAGKLRKWPDVSLRHRLTVGNVGQHREGIVPDQVQSCISSKISLGDAFRIDFEGDTRSEHPSRNIIYVPYGGGAVVVRQYLPCRQHEIVSDGRMRIRVVVGSECPGADEMIQVRPDAGLAHYGGIALIFFHDQHYMLALRHLSLHDNGRATGLGCVFGAGRSHHDIACRGGRGEETAGSDGPGTD